MHSFRYFEPLHIHALLTWIFISFIIILIPLLKKGLEKGIYTKLLGIFMLFAKVFDIYFRIVFEREPWYSTMPLNLCNISLILAGIYLLTNNNLIFNIVYFYFTGAILAVILPNTNPYTYRFYIYVFIGTHILEILAVTYAFILLNAKVTKKGLYVSLVLYLILSFIARVYNNHFGTNFMFLNDYVISAVNFIKPLNLYAVLYTLLFMISMIVTYLPFIYVDNTEIKEENI